MTRVFAAAVVLSALASGDARASWFVQNESDNKIEVTVLQAYNGAGDDDNFTVRASFTLGPGGSREIGAKWMRTNTFWLVVKDLKTGKIRRTGGDWKDGDKLLASVTLESCWTRTDLEKSTYDNAFVTQQMLKGNWEPLKTFIGEKKLTKLSAMRLSPAWPHGRDPGFSVKVTNSEVTWRRYWK
ncbi:MAG: hypothetical protein ACRC33_20075 [Gemmataceae bacterium]